jgi:PAS domain S-box-containing protein
MVRKKNTKAEKELLVALKESKKRQAESAALLEGTRAVLESKNFQEAAASIYFACKNLIKATSGYIALVSEDGKRNEVSFLDSGGLPCSVDPNLPMPLRGLRQVAYNFGETIYDNNFSISEFIKFIPDGHVNLENVLFAPLKIKGKVVGLLGLANKTGGFTDEDARLASGFGELAAIALLNKRNEELLHKAHDELEKKILERTGELIKSEERLAEAQRIAHLGNWDWNIITNELHWSDEIYRIFGLTPQQFGATYDAFLNYVHPDDREFVKKSVNEALYGKPYNIEHRIILPDGTTKLVHEQGKVTFGESGEPIRMLGTVQDITEKKENEIRLILSEKLASLGQVASGIAHEINNPLAAISACAEGLLNRIKRGRIEPELFENYLEIINQEITRCKSITTSMLSFVRKTSHEKKDIDINYLLDEALDLIGFQGRLKDVEVIKDYRAMAAVKGSEGELRQILLSIIVNAIDAMENKGTLKIETGVKDKNVFIKISDTGPGIPQENINRIFDPFFTTRSEKGGIGLGLSIAKKLISDNKGNIDVFSEEGKGATFKITFPLL